MQALQYHIHLKNYLATHINNHMKKWEQCHILSYPQKRQDEILNLTSFSIATTSTLFFMRQIDLRLIRKLPAKRKECDHCDQAMCWAWNLRMHVKKWQWTHNYRPVHLTEESGGRLLKCNMCNYGFSQANILRAHVKTNSNGH